MNRRGFLQLTRGAMAAGAIAMLDRKNAAIAQTYSKATRGLPAATAMSIEYLYVVSRACFGTKVPA